MPCVNAKIDPVARLEEVRDRLTKALDEAGLPQDATKIVAVTKRFEADHIRPVLAAGHRVFGENRVQEAQGKWPTLREAYPDITLHLIGPLQSNKADDAVALFDVIETIDRPKIAGAVAKAMDKLDRRPRCLVQVNTGEEPQKAGVTPADALNFVKTCRTEYGLPIEGLMCIPPVDAVPAPHFALLAKLAGEAGLTTLSMGMSGDYEAAAQLGATHVRVGSGIFGPRPA